MESRDTGQPSSFSSRDNATTDHAESASADLMANLSVSGSDSSHSANKHFGVRFGGVDNLSDIAIFSANIILGARITGT